MDILKNFSQRANRAMAVFRDVAISGAPQAAVSQAAPARPAGAWKQQYIDQDDFTAGAAWRTGEDIRLASFLLPTDREWRIPSGERFSFYVKAVSRFNGQNLGAPAARTVTLATLQRTTQTKVLPTLPSTYHPEVAVWCLVGGNWVKATITAVNYATNQVTFTEPAAVANAADNIRVYFTSSAGSFRFRVARELGRTDDVVTSVLNDSFSKAHSIDQMDSRLALFWPQDTLLVPRQRLVLEVNSSVEMVWGPQAEHLINIYAFSREIAVDDYSELGQKAEAFNRRGF